MTLVPRTPDDGPVPLESRHRWIVLLAEVGQLAHAIANTEFVPKALRGDEAAIAAAILYGDEVGLSPMQSLAKIAVIDGRPALAAEAQRALILAAGHQLWFEDMTVTKVTVAGRRAGAEQIVRVTWTMDDAKRAGIAGKQNWRSYPRAMLIARASAELARSLFADAIGGLAATEELDDIGDTPPPTEPEPVELKSATSRRRRNTPAAAPVIAPVLPEPPPPPLPPLPEEEEADEPAVPTITEPQLRKLHAMFGERAISDRDERLDWVNARLERTVMSTSELTDVEASMLIGELQQQPAVQAELAVETIADEDVDVLSWMRREAGVDDDWLRNKLAGLGVEGLPVQITRQTIKRLTKPQMVQLADALNTEIDARREEQQ
jgi:hypothetical protein